jgi:Tfp pilus assembly protein PilW
MKLFDRSSPHNERGETLVGMLVALLISSVVMAAAVSNFSDAWRRSSDLRMMAQTQTEARTLLDLLAYDFRMIGSGVPMGQAGFQIDATGLGTAPLPLLTSSTASSVVARLNENGTSSVLTANYTPSSSALTFSVLSTAGFGVGDTIYLSNMTAGGTGGMQGVIQSLGTNSITLNSTYNATASTTFSSGSLIERVSTITYNSPSDGSGITRNTGSGTMLLSPRSSFTVAYLDSAGTSLTLPLTATSIKSSLAALQISVSVTSSRKLLNGKNYTATTQQTIALRNINLSR